MKNRGTMIELPKFLYVELTDRCNLACPMCRTSQYKGSILSVTIFKRIAQELFPYAEWVDLRGWGESTLLPNLYTYISIAKEYDIKLKLITNGTVKRKNLWENLAEAKFMVGFSVDSANDENFKRLRGGGSLTIVKQNLVKAIQSYTRAMLDPSEYLYFCITVSQENIHELKDICNLGLEYGINWFKLEPIWAPDNNSICLESNTSSVHQSIDELNEYAQLYNVNIEYSASLLPDITDKVSTHKLCIHPWKYGYINARGRLGFCDHLNGREEYLWGNFDDGFLDWWNGERMSTLRLQHEQRLHGTSISSCPDCNWCYDRRYVDLEYLIQPDWLQYRKWVQ